MKGLAIASLVLGIIGVVICWIGIGIIPAILALIFGFIACFKRVGRGMAIAGLVLGIIGTIISASVIYVGSHPEIIWQTGREMLKEIEDKEKFLEQYSEEVRKKAAKNANIPDMLTLTNPDRYMELVIKELNKHPESYPTKVKEVVYGEETGKESTPFKVIGAERSQVLDVGKSVQLLEVEYYSQYNKTDDSVFIGTLKNVGNKTLGDLKVRITLYNKENEPIIQGDGMTPNNFIIPPGKTAPFWIYFLESKEALKPYAIKLFFQESLSANEIIKFFGKTYSDIEITNKSVQITSIKDSFTRTNIDTWMCKGEVINNGPYHAVTTVIALWIYDKNDNLLAVGNWHPSITSGVLPPDGSCVFDFGKEIYGKIAPIGKYEMKIRSYRHLTSGELEQKFR